VSLFGGEQPAVIDPFSGGRQLTPDGLLALIANASRPGGFPDELHLAAMTNRMALTRLLLNQASRAEGEGDPARAAILYERITIVAPGEPRGWWELARLQIAANDIPAARGSLAAMLEISIDPEQRERVLAALDAIG
jgi:regulator of sirC expression with transglutaminase-like and TPR domain